MNLRLAPALIAMLSRKPAHLLLAGLAISSAFGGTVNLATNFNAPNNGTASSVFSYGVGGTPAAFVTLSNPTPNCVGTPTYCYDNGQPEFNTSAVTWNGTAGTDSYSTVVQPNTMVRLDPQSSAGTIVEFTAPTSDTYTVNGLFQGIDTGQHSVNTEVFVNGAQQGSTGVITSFGGQAAFSFSSALLAGQKIDFIVTSDSDCCHLSTGLQGTIANTAVSPTPEPNTLAFLGIGSLALAARAIRGKRRPSSRKPGPSLSL